MHIATVIFASILASVSAQNSSNITSSPFVCPPRGGAYCNGTSLMTNIILRCDYGTTQSANCSELLAGVEPVGVKDTAQCFETSPNAGDAACSYNGLEWPDTGQPSIQIDDGRVLLAVGIGDAIPLPPLRPTGYPNSTSNPLLSQTVSFPSATAIAGSVPASTSAVTSALVSIGTSEETSSAKATLVSSSSALPSPVLGTPTLPVPASQSTTSTVQPATTTGSLNSITVTGFANGTQITSDSVQIGPPTPVTTMIPTSNLIPASDLTTAKFTISVSTTEISSTTISVSISTESPSSTTSALPIFTASILATSVSTVVTTSATISMINSSQLSASITSLSNSGPSTLTTSVTSVSTTELTSVTINGTNFSPSSPSTSVLRAPPDVLVPGLLAAILAGFRTTNIISTTIGENVSSTEGVLKHSLPSPSSSIETTTEKSIASNFQTLTSKSTVSLLPGVTTELHTSVFTYPGPPVSIVTLTLTSILFPVGTLSSTFTLTAPGIRTLSTIHSTFSTPVLPSVTTTTPPNPSPTIRTFTSTHFFPTETRTIIISAPLSTVAIPPPMPEEINLAVSSFTTTAASTTHLPAEHPAPAPSPEITHPPSLIVGETNRTITPYASIAGGAAQTTPMIFTSRGIAAKEMRGMMFGIGVGMGIYAVVYALL